MSHIVDDLVVKETKAPPPTYGNDEKQALSEKQGLEPTVSSDKSDSLGDVTNHVEDDGTIIPTETEMETLRRVSGKIPWLAFSVTFVEFCERFSWYGTTQVFTNFIQQNRPPFSRTGAITTTASCIAQFGKAACEQPGALGQGQQAAAGLTTFNQFWAYVMPLVGAYVADEYLGRYATIQWSIMFAMIGHILLIVSALPTVIDHPQSALGCFSLALVILGIGTGGFKSNVSVLVAEQIKDRRVRIKVIEKTGERVIEDPFITISRVYHYFYLMINIGSLVGGIGMIYAERYIGFWLAYLLPTVLFCFAPMVLFLLKNRYVRAKPSHSVLGRSLVVLRLGARGRWSLNPVRTYRNFTDGTFWENIKPSKLQNPPSWYGEIDDAWIDQVKRGYSACKVFLWYPLYWLSYNQMSNNLISQAATIQTHGLPNELLSNLDPLALVILIPLFDVTLYPLLRKLGIPFTPIKRITLGFIIASMAMIAATVTQYYIYHLGACGYYMNDCVNSDGIQVVAPINVWVQTLPYVLIAISEIFASITSLEYAFTKAPENMRSIIQAVALFQTALASALGEALNPLTTDPLLIWNYGVVAVAAFIGGIGFWLSFKNLDKEEDALNHLKETEYQGRSRSIIGDEQARVHLAEAMAEANQQQGNR